MPLGVTGLLGVFRLGPENRNRSADASTDLVSSRRRRRSPRKKHDAQNYVGVVRIARADGGRAKAEVLVDSLQLRDFPLIEATILLAAAVYIAANFFADVAAILLNPRLRTG